MFDVKGFGQIFAYKLLSSLAIRTRNASTAGKGTHHFVTEPRGLYRRAKHSGSSPSGLYHFCLSYNLLGVEGLLQ